MPPVGFAWPFRISRGHRFTPVVRHLSWQPTPNEGHGPGAEALLQVAGGGAGRQAGLGARIRDAVAAEGAGHAAALGAGRGDAVATSSGRRRSVVGAFVLLRRAVTALPTI